MIAVAVAGPLRVLLTSQLSPRGATTQPCTRACASLHIPYPLSIPLSPRLSHSDEGSSARRGALFLLHPCSPTAQIGLPGAYTLWWALAKC